jgi:hypothetical protein
VMQQVTEIQSTFERRVGQILCGAGFPEMRVVQKAVRFMGVVVRDEVIRPGWGASWVEGQLVLFHFTDGHHRFQALALADYALALTAHGFVTHLVIPGDRAVPPHLMVESAG